jgi:hypothetical protein
MSTPGDDDDVVAAVLIQIARHAERIADLGSRLDAVTTILGRHASVLNSVDGIDKQVAAVDRQLAELAAGSAVDDDAYEPAPAPRWWQLRDAERSSATGRLRAWVEQVYRPGYGHLSGGLPVCWEQHPLCLYTLDWLSELWSALYISSSRSAGTLAGQAEWQTRLLPAAADQMVREAAGCRHSAELSHPAQIRPSQAGPPDQRRLP